MQMRVAIAENKKKLSWKECSPSEHSQAEEKHSADNRSVKPMQFSFGVTPGESGHKNICQQIHQHGENHCEPSERSHLRDRSRVTSEKTNQEHGDLTLKRIKKRVGGQVFDQPHDLAPIFRVFVGP